MMLWHFEGENTDDLNERFDEIARNPQEFLGWLLIATTRVPAKDKFALAVEVAVALYGYIVAGIDDEMLDDEMIVGADECICGVLDFKDRRKQLHRGPNATEHDAASPFDFFASRAVEDVRDAAEVNAP